jgi:uncharacterized membrane protein
VRRIGETVDTKERISKKNGETVDTKERISKKNVYQFRPSTLKTINLVHQLSFLITIIFVLMQRSMFGLCLLFLSIVHIQIHTHLKWGGYG